MCLYGTKGATAKVCMCIVSSCVCFYVVMCLYGTRRVLLHGAGGVGCMCIVSIFLRVFVCVYVSVWY
jgi:hypothetical protein